MTQLHMHRTC